jgi:hypothetical protein
VANKVFIATPTGEGRVTNQGAQTILTAINAFTKAGFTYRQAFFDGANVVNARNLFANAFLADAETTHLFFVDSDMDISGEVIARMIAFDKPLVGVIATERKLDLDRFADAIRSGASKERALALASNFIFLPPKGQIEVSKGFARMEAVGFGCVVIKREVFTAMIERGLAKKAPPGRLSRLGVGEEFTDFFSDLVLPQGGRLGEDFSFCLRARECGFEVWSYAAAAIGHVGPFTYGASFLEFLKAQADKQGSKETS